MNNIKIAEAKNYCLKRLNNYEGKIGKRLLIQMMLSIEKKVIQYEETNTPFNLEPFLIGIYFHDLGRILSDGDDHPELSYKLFDEYKNDKDFSLEEIEIIKDCCLNHGSSSTPITKEGKYLQILDKSIVFEPEIILIVLEELVEKEGSWEKGYKKFIEKMNKWHTKIPDQKVRNKFQTTLDYLNKL